MKLRAPLTAVLIAALAAPLWATTARYTDVPEDHDHAASIAWASNPANFPNRAALFVGYGDKTFKPDKDLTENQLQTVIRRLFDTQDSWTRAETAALLHHGYTALYPTPPPADVEPTTTKHPFVIEEPTTTAAPSGPVSSSKTNPPPVVNETTTTTITTDPQSRPGPPEGDNTPPVVIEQTTTTTSSTTTTTTLTATTAPFCWPSSERPTHFLITDGFHDVGTPHYNSHRDTETHNHVVYFGDTVTFTLQAVNSKGEPLNWSGEPLGVEIHSDGGHFYSSTVTSDVCGEIEWSWVRNTPDSEDGEYAHVTIKIITHDGGPYLRPRKGASGNWDIYTHQYRWEPFPLEDSMKILNEHIQDSINGFQRATAAGLQHRRTYAAAAKKTADKTLRIANELKTDYASYAAKDSAGTARVDGAYKQALKWHTDIMLVYRWQTDPQPADTAEKKSTSDAYAHTADFQRLPTNVQSRIQNLEGAISAASGVSKDTRRSIYRYIYYHALDVAERLDQLERTLPTSQARAAALYFNTSILSQMFHSSTSTSAPFVWLMTDAGFTRRSANWPWNR